MTESVTKFHSVKRVRVCEECDLVVALPPMPTHGVARCPQCQHTLAHRQPEPVRQVLAWSLTALILLIMAVQFEFVSFATTGLGEQIVLVDTMYAMLERGEVFITLVLSLTMVVLPVCYLTGLIYLHVGIGLGGSWWGLRTLAKWVHLVKPWLMADVFLIGALVSLVKVSASAEIGFGFGFWAYAAFALTVLQTSRCVDRDWLWFALAGEGAVPASLNIGKLAEPQGIIGCHRCGTVNEIDPEAASTDCQRCGETLKRWSERGQNYTIALLIAAILLYIPANIFPIMITVDYSGALPSTIVGGVIELWQNGSEPVAAIIFLASIVVPVAKIAALIWLLYTRKRVLSQGSRRARMLLYRMTDLIGRWSMIDVFVVALLVALIQAGAVMSVFPGPAAAAFAGVVVLTMLAEIEDDKGAHCGVGKNTVPSL